ncbi:hypothetical protein [Candidatus Amarolinea dominans]|uniref:hypothetical protein n=1 Tax=Candidatus Amarolinea dominans TaxID=3140696 RepID=UPI00313473FC|nr:hypothetical protein [Anaerolineae bacterium]
MIPGATAYDGATTTFTFTPVQPFGPGTFVVTSTPATLRGSENDNVGHDGALRWTIAEQPTAAPERPDRDGITLWSWAAPPCWPSSC